MIPNGIPKPDPNVVEIRIMINQKTGNVGVMAPMEDEEQKKFTVMHLTQAINLVLAYRKSAIISPNGHSVPLPPRIDN